MKITLRYMVPTYVTVDTEKGTVDKVRVDDTAAVDAETGWWEPEDPTPGVSYQDMLAAKTRAQHIADEAEWPAWELGDA